MTIITYQESEDDAGNCRVYCGWRDIGRAGANVVNHFVCLRHQRRLLRVVVCQMCYYSRRPRDWPRRRNSPVGLAPRATKTWRMSILSELRSPTKWYAKLLTAAVASAFLAILSPAAGQRVLCYHAVAPQPS